MWIYAWNKQLKEAYVSSTPIKEIYLWNAKVRPEEPKYNLDLNNGQPIWRLHDGELWFRVNVKDASEPFKIATNGYLGTSYDWDISIDGNTPTRHRGGKSTTPIELPMTIGRHYIKITPHNWVVAGWARCMGNSGYNNWMHNYRNTDPTKLEFGLERLPGYAFMETEDRIGNNFLYYTWAVCPTITSMPAWFNLPQWITSISDSFLHGTWYSCTSLNFIYNWFNIPQNITKTGAWFLKNAWRGCVSLTSMPEGFNLPQGIVRISGGFLEETWEGCSSLTSMPSGFNIPQWITSGNTFFLRSTWNGCSSLASMPYWFNIPQGITSISHFCLITTWNDCSLLTSDFPDEPISFPNVSWTDYARNCFWGSCPITPDTPAPWSSVMVHRS